MNASTEMDDSARVWLAGSIPADLFATPLSNEVSAIIVNRLKQEADRYWYIDPNISLEYASRILIIGRARADKSQLALGLMARGDALKFLGDVQESWNMLEQSGSMYQEAGDEVGWARTRIGLVY